MSQLHPSAFSRWLAAATDGVPAAASHLVSAELSAHFEDAVADYQDEGLSLEEARSRALSDLGLPDLTGRGLKDVHRGRRHYKLAALASLLILANMFLLPTIIYSVLAGNPAAARAALIVGDLVLAGLTAYVLLALRRLLVWRFDKVRLGVVFDGVIAGYLLWIAADVTSVFALDLTLYIGSMRPLAEAVSGLDLALILLATAGQFAVALGGLVVSGALWISEENLYGIGKPLALGLVVMALPIGTASLALNLGADIAYQILALLSMVAHASLWPILTLLFVRAVFHPRGLRPARFA